ncbi:uncharacterized protein LOC131671826 [Phymastichus coffea]|uniref:uncharacterized protein LOC131671826 n=1 Tax=Phymastichus coffea TaxID=108790 RepID=UPI00273CCC4A|nr:uncharacterized protein LOC131671826 [Phymastichus coffea]
MAQRVMRDDGQHAYHYRAVQELHERDAQNRIVFCQFLLNEIDADPGFMDRILWTDESTYVRKGMFNQHNEHQWAHENPHMAREDRFQNRFSVNIWTGLIGNQVIGPVQLPNPLNAKNYLEFLQDILPGLLDGVPEELQENLIFMHDGASAHTAANVRNYLDQVYGGHWIGNNGPVRWPVKSPDLNPLDYFYWRTSKEAVYHNGGLNDPNDMIQRIQHHAQHLEPEKIHAATHQIRRRAILCIQQQGGHFEQCLDSDDGGDDVVEEEDENGDDVDVNGNDENGEDDDDDMNNDGENDGSEDGEADDSMDEDDDDVGNDPDWEI